MGLLLLRPLLLLCCSFRTLQASCSACGLHTHTHITATLPATLPCCRHIQTLRKRKARGGGGEGAEEDDSDAKPADGWVSRWWW